MDTLIVLITLVGFIVCGKIVLNIDRYTTTTLGKIIEAITWVITTAALLFPIMGVIDFLTKLDDPRGEKWAGVAAIYMLSLGMLLVKWLNKLIFTKLKL